MAFNFGAFAGGLGSGIESGMRIGKNLKDIRNQAEIEDIQRSGWDDAERMRQEALTSGLGGIQQVDNPAIEATVGNPSTGAGATPAMPASTEYSLGGKTYKTRQEAEKQAASSVPDTQSFFEKNAVQKIKEAYLKQGNPDAAESWDKWATKSKGRRAISDWSKPYLAAQRGDLDAAASGFGKFYTDHIDDGIDYVGHKPLNDANGNPIGFIAQMKNKETGEISEMPVDKATMLNFAESNNPQTLYQNDMNKQIAAEKMRAETASELAKEGRKLGGQVQLKQIDLTSDVIKERQRQKNRLEEEGVKAKLKSAETGKIGENINAMRNNGIPEDKINEYLVSTLIEGNEYKKTTDPRERANIIASQLTNTDPTFSSPRLTDEDRTKRVLSLMQTADNAVQAYEQNKAPKPAAQGLPARQQPSNAAQQGTVFTTWDNKLKKNVSMVRLPDGRIVRNSGATGNY